MALALYFASLRLCEKISSNFFSEIGRARGGVGKCKT